MKRLMALSMIALLGGCQVAEEIKQGVHDAPVTFWDSVKEVIMFLGNLLFGILSGWFQGLFG